MKFIHQTKRLTVGVYAKCYVNEEIFFNHVNRYSSLLLNLIEGWIQKTNYDL